MDSGGAAAGRLGVIRWVLLTFGVAALVAVTLFARHQFADIALLQREEGRGLRTVLSHPWFAERPAQRVGGPRQDPLLEAPLPLADLGGHEVEGGAELVDLIRRVVEEREEVLTHGRAQSVNFLPAARQRCQTADDLLRVKV